MIKVRDQHANIREGFEDEVEFENGIDVLSEDGKVLFNIDLKDDGSLSIHGGDYAKVQGKIIGSSLELTPRATNHIIISKKIEASGIK